MGRVLNGYDVHVLPQKANIPLQGLDRCVLTVGAISGPHCQIGALNGPYSLLIRASYFISCSVHARFASVLSIDCKWRWGCRYF